MMYKSMIAMMACIPALAAAGTLTPLKPAEIEGGAGCYLVDETDNTIVDSKVKIDGNLISVKPTVTDSKTINWKGSNIAMEFRLRKGKVLADKDEEFTVGRTALGELSITYKGATSSIKARQECAGPD